MILFIPENTGRTIVSVKIKKMLKTA